jgi:hypothetical protein
MYSCYSGIEGVWNMEYIVDEKPVSGILKKIKWMRLPHNRKADDDLRRYIGYAKIPGLNNNQRIFLNKGYIVTDVDI